jgi:nicotinate-nucleotide adenylyltransferase
MTEPSAGPQGGDAGTAAAEPSPRGRTRSTLTDAGAGIVAAATAHGLVPKSRPRIGVMGGTFDPIHHGHLVAASEVAAWFDLDEVVFVPTGQPWQKSDREVSPAEHRYLMTVIATASNPRFTASRIDIDRPGPTYTVDTLRDLRGQRGPEVDLYFITGADALDQILSWHDVDEMFTLAHFVGCTRPGVKIELGHLTELPGDRLTIVEVPALAISSTECRARVAEGDPIWYLVPDGIVQYIQKAHLYGSR